MSSISTKYLMTTLCPKGVLKCTIVSNNTHMQYTISASLQRLCTTLKREGKKERLKTLTAAALTLAMP